LTGEHERQVKQNELVFVRARFMGIKDGDWLLQPVGADGRDVWTATIWAPPSTVVTAQEVRAIIKSRGRDT
jgi:hypothetical protein